MRIFKTTPEFTFHKHNKFFITLSSIVIICSAITLFIKGLNYGIDFNGGTIVQIQFDKAPDLTQIRSELKNAFQTELNVNTFGDIEENEILVFLNISTGNDLYERLSTMIQSSLSPYYSHIDIRRTETVGPKVGKQLRLQALSAVIYALIGILIYIAIRFQFRYGIGAIISLFHDIMVILGIFSIFQLEFNLTTIAAILTIVGYSLNDTIVIFDRIRENLARSAKSQIEIFDISINETLNRTIMTSLTTFVVVISLYFFGGEIIKNFSLAIIIGVIFGSYSSIFIASPTVIYFQRNLSKIKKDEE